jgi:hypothetical protein
MVRAAAVEHGLAGPKHAFAAGAGLIINENVSVMICSDSLLALAFSRGSEVHERAQAAYLHIGQCNFDGIVHLSL